MLRDADSLDKAGIRGGALSLLVGGGVCLYFGLALVPTAPASAGPQQVEQWLAADRLLFWWLKAAGLLLLIAAGLSLAGGRSAALLAAVAELDFGLLMIVMSVEWTIKARMDGWTDYQVILLLILAVLGLSGAWHSWKLYLRAGRADRRSPAQSPPGQAVG